jgi:hypothetical protein
MQDDTRHDKTEPGLEAIDEAKRETLRRIVRASVYAVPVVASFAVDGLTVSPALAGGSNSS